MVAISEFLLTDHAQRRMQQRGVRPAALSACLIFGRRIRAHGAVWLVMGKREVERARRAGIRIDSLNGLQALVIGGTVLTVYRNTRAFPYRDLPPRASCSAHRNRRGSETSSPFRGSFSHEKEEITWDETSTIVRAPRAERAA